jgi:outer membrane protein OmpA-like peptidoglycan-associated protein
MSQGARRGPEARLEPAAALQFLRSWPLASIAFALLVVLSGCATNTGTVLDRKTTQGAILGTLAGAAAGAAIDDKAGRGALIGAAAGAVTGGLIGNYLDRQAAEIDAIPDANVERRGDLLTVAFPGDLLYASGSAGLAPGGYQRLRSLSRTMVDYPDTDIIVKGHTDSVGSEPLNQDLSERRAENVRNFLVAEGVSGSRVRAFGFGEGLPVATNATPEGRQQNRRAEIELRPNASLRERDALQGGRTY